GRECANHRNALGCRRTALPGPGSLGGIAGALRGSYGFRHGAKIEPHRRGLLVSDPAEGAVALLRAYGAGSRHERGCATQPKSGAVAGCLVGMLRRSPDGRRRDVGLPSALDGYLVSCAGSLRCFSSTCRRPGITGSRLRIAAHHLWRLHPVEARWLNDALLHRPRPISISLSMSACASALCARWPCTMP